MSKWTDVRDNVVDALHVSDVTEDVKQHVTSALLSEVVPVIENAVDSFCDSTKEQSKSESGWCRAASTSSRSCSVRRCRRRRRSDKRTKNVLKRIQASDFCV